jgi:hypothetical protein
MIKELMENEMVNNALIVFREMVSEQQPDHATSMIVVQAVLIKD